MKKSHIDLNCDLGEGFGAYAIGDDETLFKMISSANIACGWHAGDAATMRRSVQLSIQNDVAIGAHPGLPDLSGFGRRSMTLTADEVYEAVLYQMGALSAFVRAAGSTMHHVKPHGALYNAAATNREWADAIARAVTDFDPSLVLVGLANSHLIQAGQERELKTAGEAFADRTYQADGSLTKRSEPNALIDDAKQAADQAYRIVSEGKVRSLQGTDIDVDAVTICIHGDRMDAVKIADAIRQRLLAANVTIRSFD